MNKNKKGQAMQALAQLGVGIATIAIVLVVAFLVMSQGKSQITDIESLDTDNDGTLNNTECEASMACNSTSSLQSAVDTIPAWIPLVIIAVVGSVLLGLVALFKR